VHAHVFSRESKAMKTLAIVASFILLAAWATASDIPWTHASEEGEDATSSHYYFYQSGGASVERVRWVWNGGAQNAPTVTEYVFETGKLTIRHLEGKRDAIPALIAGKEAELAVKEEYTVVRGGGAGALLPIGSGKTLTEKQRADIVNLIDLLARERESFGGKKAAEKLSE
jgi:hypothetical protein